MCFVNIKCKVLVVVVIFVKVFIFGLVKICLIDYLGVEGVVVF